MGSGSTARSDPLTRRLQQFVSRPMEDLSVNALKHPIEVREAEARYDAEGKP